LIRAHSFLNRLFELRSEIAISIAKDTLIIDTHYLDKKNPVYKEFALCLSKLNIALVTLMNGVTKDELYSFQHFTLTGLQMTSSQDIEHDFNTYDLPHIKIRCIDYATFRMADENNADADPNISLWKQYIAALIEGQLQIEEAPDMILEVPPEKLAGFINSLDMGTPKAEIYDKIISSYIKRSSETSFTGMEIKKLVKFINGLRPKLKQPFLSSAVNNLSGDPDSIEKLLDDMTEEDVRSLLNHIYDHTVVIPEALKNILDKFAKTNPDGFKSTYMGGGLIGDDMLLSSGVTSILSQVNFKAFVTEDYYKDIERILNTNAIKAGKKWLDEHEGELYDEYLVHVFNQMLLDIMSSDCPDAIPQEEHDMFANIIKDNSVQFIETGQYREVHQTILSMESNIAKGFMIDIAHNVLEYFASETFTSMLVNSFRVAGRETRGEAESLCAYFGEKIVNPLMDALIDEESLSTRKFILGLISIVGNTAIPEAMRRLNDERWFVKRNMLFILMKCGDREALRKVAPYCSHKNPKVAFESIKCLLTAEDNRGIFYLRKYLNDKSREIVTMALSVSGAYRVRGVMPDLIRMMKKMAIRSSDFDYKIPVVRAIGQIGDKSGVEFLRDFLSSKALLFRGSLEKLKDEIRLVINRHDNDNPAVTVECRDERTIMRPPEKAREGQDFNGQYE
jgi:hypothetical protein